MKEKTKERGVFERPAGSGVWWVRYADTDGKIRRIKVGKQASALAVYHRKKVSVREQQLGIAPVPPPVVVPRKVVTVDDAIDDALERSKHLSSVCEYKRAGDLWKEAFGRRPLDSITPGDIERWRSAHLAEWSPATMNRHLAFLRRVFTLAIGDGVLATSPFRSVKLAKENNERVRFLTEEEETRLREAMDPVDWLAVAFAIATGLRQGEQFGARWEHIDFENLDLVVPRSKHGEKRHIPLSPLAVDTLLELQRYAKGSGWVFPSEAGTTHVDTQNFVNRIFKPALVEAKIENFKWHDLRHTFCSRLAMEGVPIEAIARLAGHKNDRMTQRYTHLSNGYLRDAISKVRLAPTDTTTSTAVATPTVH